VAKGEGYLSEAIAAAFQSPFAVGAARGHSALYEGGVDTVYLGCWRKEAFTKFGCFDEELVRNQDDEYNLRVVRSGGKIWQSPTIRSWYRPRGSLPPLFKQYMQYGYWKVRVIQKHKIPASLRHLVPGTFLLMLLLLAAGSVFYPVCLWPLAGLLGTYASSVLCGSVITAAKTNLKYLPALPLVFGCYHFGYGWGFLRGVVDFMLLKIEAGKSFVQLTRTSEPNATRYLTGNRTNALNCGHVGAECDSTPTGLTQNKLLTGTEIG